MTLQRIGYYDDFLPPSPDTRGLFGHIFLCCGYINYRVRGWESRVNNSVNLITPWIYDYPDSWF